MFKNQDTFYRWREETRDEPTPRYSCSIDAASADHRTPPHGTSDAKAKRQTGSSETPRAGRGTPLRSVSHCPPITPPALSRPLPRARSDPPPMATAMGAMAATCMASMPAAATFPGDLGVGRRRAAVPGWRAGGRRLRATPPARRPFLFSPKGVSDSRSSQTCLDPDASTVRDKKKERFFGLFDGIRWVAKIPLFASRISFSHPRFRAYFARVHGKWFESFCVIGCKMWQNHK